MSVAIIKTVKHTNTITHYTKSYIIKDWCDEPRTFNVYRKSDSNYLTSKVFKSLDSVLKYIEKHNLKKERK